MDLQRCRLSSVCIVFCGRRGWFLLLNSGCLRWRRPELSEGDLVDGLLLGDAQLQKDIFLLFCHSVVFGAFYSFPSHLLNKCNCCYAIRIKAEKTHPSPFSYRCTRSEEIKRFWRQEWDIACQFKFNERVWSTTFAKMWKKEGLLGEKGELFESWRLNTE